MRGVRWHRHPENKYIVCKVDVKFNELGYLQICILNDAKSRYELALLYMHTERLVTTIRNYTDHEGERENLFM